MSRMTGVTGILPQKQASCTEAKVVSSQMKSTATTYKYVPPLRYVPSESIYQNYLLGTQFDQLIYSTQSCVNQLDHLSQSLQQDTPLATFSSRPMSPVTNIISKPVQQVSPIMMMTGSNSTEHSHCTSCHLPIYSSRQDLACNVGCKQRKQPGKQKRVRFLNHVNEIYDWREDDDDYQKSAITSYEDLLPAASRGPKPRLNLFSTTFSCTRAQVND